MEETRKIMDGCTAATYVAYALSDMATIYPITPIASMGETAQKWAVQGRKNLMGQTMQVKELESELGAAGATHGALAAGGLATTFTSSQGLMLMIPNMYKISGNMLPGVFHVGTRSLATHALSIYGDHQDVMACRATGFGFLASCTVQETQDLALVAHLAAIEGSLPICHFFDGWRTSNQMETISLIPYEAMRPLVNWEAVRQFRYRGLNPEHPVLRGSAQNPDVYFQNREAPNGWYKALPGIVQKYMDKVGDLTGRRYHLFDYVGAKNPDHVIVVIGSAGEVIEQTLEVLNPKGYNDGVVKVRLYRPLSEEALLAAIPQSVKRVTVLDRTKEPGAQGEPLYKDVATALLRAGRDLEVFGGRYGLSSKEFTPAMVKAILDNARSDEPKREFTVGIDDDLTHLSLKVEELIIPAPQKMLQAKFYGFGSDGTVGATKQAAAVLSDTLGLYAQAYFQYSAKKSGGYTISQLRMSPQVLKADYSIENADYVACHKDTYVTRYKLVESLKEGGIFVLNSAWNDVATLDKQLPASLRRAIAAKKAKFYNVDAAAIAAKNSLGVRINMIMETAFLYLMRDSIDFPKAFAALKEQIKETYIHEGQKVVDNNLAALADVQAAIKEIDYPADWLTAPDSDAPKPHYPMWVRNVAKPCLDLEGNKLPVSAMSIDGSMPMGTTAYEKRRIALRIPRWDVDKCIECTLCSFVCAHAAIRPFLLDADQKEAAPQALVTKEAVRIPNHTDLQWRIQVYPEDCTGCGSCATICPGHALTMVPLHEDMDAQIPLLAYCQEKVGYRPGILPRFTVRGSQMYQPLLQFSGACGGCGETPYVKLLTQLFGERMVMANATGCSSIWGANYPSNAYCTNKDGHGPAWSNSLFEDNAEFGYGMTVAIDQRRAQLKDDMTAAAADAKTPADVATALKNMVAAMDNAEGSAAARDALMPLLEAQLANPTLFEIYNRRDMMVKKSVWAIGGDGWAYDIGFAGLDHVLARRNDINILVMDTECYSNTGGQMSKATPISCRAKYAPDGKRTFKKDLGRMMMSYGNVYVASIALGANYQGAIEAIKEAEAYPGPSIVICYCPCIAHGIRAGMGTTIVEEKRAVESGYWPLYRYNPLLAAQGKNPLTVDYKAPDGSLASYLAGESRYEALREKDPKEADILQPKLAEGGERIYEVLTGEAGLKTC